MPGLIFAGLEPDDTDETDAAPYTLGLEVQPASSTQVTGVWWRVPDTLPGAITAAIWAVGGGNPLLASKGLTPGASGWTVFTFDDPVDVIGGGDYVIGVLTPARYVYSLNKFSGGPISAGGWQATVGRLNSGGSLTYPGGGTNTWFGLDVAEAAPPEEHEGTGEAEFTLAASGSGLAVRPGSSAAGLSLAGSSAGAAVRPGAGSAALGLAASAVGSAVRPGTGMAGITLTATATGYAVRSGTGTATLHLAATGSGQEAGERELVVRPTGGLVNRPTGGFVIRP